MNNSVSNHNNKLIPNTVMSKYFHRGQFPSQSVNYGTQSFMNQRTDDYGTNLVIYNSFTGLKITTSFNKFSSMESLKQYIADSLNIDSDRLFLLTPFGIKLKFSMIVHEQIHEIFAFDRKFFNPSLVNAEKTDGIIKNLILTLEEHDDALISMIKPRESPLNSINLGSFISSTTKLLNNQKLISSSELDFDSMRLILNLLKRNSGWATALLSDMKSFIFNSNSDSIKSLEYENIENILKALNALIQYVSNLFLNLEKEFNTIVEVFINLSKSTNVTKWESQFKLLEEIMFSYYDKDHKIQRKLKLSELVNAEKAMKSSEISKSLEATLSNQLSKIRHVIETEIYEQKNKIVEEYEYFKTLYLNPEWKTSEMELHKKAEDIYYQLEDIVNEMIRGTEDLPPFEQLIATANELSTYISTNAIEKICFLIDQYNLQLNSYAPLITKLARELYSIQGKSSTSRSELQQKIITSNLLSVVQIQLSVRGTSKLLHTELLSNIEVMQREELNLSLITDLPLIFGIWSVSSLSNLKYGLSLNKLSRKACEIIDMLNFMERNNRSKWINEFTDALGTEKSDVLFLNNQKYKKAFISQSILEYQLVSKDSDLKEVKTETPPIPFRRIGSDSAKYLSPFNKFIQNINSFPNRSKSLSIEPLEAIKDTSVDKSTFGFFEGILANVKISDVWNYIGLLNKVQYDPGLVRELISYLQSLGIEEPKNLTETTDDHFKKTVIVKGTNLEDLGTLDSNDKHFMKILEKFVKGFESQNIKIEINLSNETERKKIDLENNEAYKTSADVGLLRSYEERNKKLENLLHERKFQYFNSKWAQSANDSITDIEQLVEANQIPDNLTGSQNVLKLPPSHYTERINKLTTENKELKEELDSFKKSQAGETILRLNQIIENQELLLKNANAKLKENNNSIKNRDKEIKRLLDQLEHMKVENNDLKDTESQLRCNIKELKIMNKDLLENMTQKEREMLKENQLNQKEKNDLLLRVEELVEYKNQYDTVSVRLKYLGDMIDHILSVLFFTFDKLRDMSNKLHRNMSSFCLILEIMGLLLIEDKDNKNNYYQDIKRVKGLRYTKRDIYRKQTGIDESRDASHELSQTKDEEDDFGNDGLNHDKLFMTIVASEALDGSRSKLGWLPDLDLQNLVRKHEKADQFVLNDKIIETKSHNRELQVKEIEENLSFLDKYECIFKEIIDTYSEETLEINYDEFVNKTLIKQDMIVEKVHGRFEDVEKLARKLQREKIQYKNDIRAASKRLSHQLVIKNFHKGDLVLFLRTLLLVPGSDEDSNSQPWTVFNIGSPNYYLNERKEQDAIQLQDKEWFVGRIKKIQKRVVDNDNKDDPDENPFTLSVGTTWYLVDAEQDSL